MTPIRLWLDTETYSPVPITNGTHRYAEHVEVMLFAWALDDDPVQVWDVTTGAPVPRRLAWALAEEDVEVYAHNTGFDRTVLRHDQGMSCPAPARWRDTMVQAMAHGLPGKLETLCDILKVDADKAKSKDGKALIQLFCKPQPFRHNLKREMFPSKALMLQELSVLQADWAGRATRLTHPAEWERFKAYAALDIDAMREVHRRLPTWNYQGAELALWHLDQRINDRGVAIDVELAECAVRAVDLEQIALKKRTQSLTNDEVQSATQRDAMLLHVLAEYGVDLPNLKKDTLERRIADPEISEGMRELLRVRLMASTSSTSKYKTLIRGVSSDGRLRGTLQFSGATRTGRWAGRLFQPQNLPSRGLLPAHEVEMGITALKADSAAMLFDNVMHLTSSAIRGCIVAPAGRKLVVADLSNIEGRVVAWLAGETWKINAFKQFDAGTGPDLYKLAYSKAFGVPINQVDKFMRSIGKVMELMLAYQGGVGAYVTGAATYAINLPEMAENAYREIPGALWGQAKIMLDWHRSKGRDPAADFKMDDRTWLVCESFVLGWRAGHPNVQSLWADVEQLVRQAIEHPGKTFLCRRLKIRRDGAWLRIVLPSGRALCYPSPAIIKDKITYMGVNQYSRKWGRIDTYAGKLVENCTQAIARDVMAHNMPHIDASGYEIVLTVHDEIISETSDDDEYNAEQLSAMLAANPPWALDLPLAAAGFEAYRYKKE